MRLAHCMIQPNPFPQLTAFLLLIQLSVPCTPGDTPILPPAVPEPIEIAHPPVEGIGLSSVVWDGRTFVAVGSKRTILRSNDGLVWQQQASNADVCFQSLGAGNGIFLALTHCSTTLISEDGIQWEPRRSPGGIVRSAAFGKGRFVTVGESGMIFVSSNAASWKSCAGKIPESLLCVRFGEDKFVAVGAQGAIMSSPDGCAWTRQDSGTSRRLQGLATGNGLWVAVGTGGTILSSREGGHWTPCESGTEDCLQAIAFGDGAFVAVGWNGRLLISRDARAWRPLTSCGGNLYDVAYGNGRFVAVGHNDTILTLGTDFTATLSSPAPHD